MKLSLSAIIASAAVLVCAAPRPRLFCPEATQFGVLTLPSTTVAPGELFEVNANFECAIDYFGNNPEFTDYYVEVLVNNNGHEPPILLARETFNGSVNNSLSVVFPIAYYVDNANYSVVLDTTFPVDGPNGEPYSVVGSVSAPINITL